MLKVLFFAQLKETLNCGEVDLELGEHKTMADVIASLSERDPVWAKALNAKRLMMAINQDLAKPESAIKDGDELAFFPPVTGG